MLMIYGAMRVNHSLIKYAASMFQDPYDMSGILQRIHSLIWQNDRISCGVCANHNCSSN